MTNIITYSQNFWSVLISNHTFAKSFANRRETRAYAIYMIVISAISTGSAERKFAYRIEDEEKIKQDIILRLHIDAHVYNAEKKLRKVKSRYNYKKNMSYIINTKKSIPTVKKAVGIADAKKEHPGQSLNALFFLRFAYTYKVS